MPTFVRLRVWGMIAAAVACSAAGQGGGQSSRNILGAEEIATEHVASAYDAVRRYRPLWLRSAQNRSQFDEPVVYLNGVRYGEVISLQQVPADAVLSMRFMVGTDATTRYGTGHSGGVILVRTKSG